MPDTTPVDFETGPDRYRHWAIELAPPVATLRLQIDPEGGLRDGYELKLNSYDLSVDIELHDIVQRLRFEHPEIGAVVVTGGLDNVFCSGANIQMLAGSSHNHKVNFCKFTNETRNAIEDATEHSGLTFIAAVNGTAAGGGYELALACDEIILVNDRSAAVSLPEVPLLAVLPGTGGLTRVVDKRLVRRDLADAFATKAEGVRAQQAIEWRLVDTIATKTDFAEVVAARAQERASTSDRPSDGTGIRLVPLERSVDVDAVTYTYVSVSIDRSTRTATITVRGPDGPQPTTGDQLATAGASAWIVAAARELDDAVLHLRFNETEIGTWVLATEGDHESVEAAESVLVSRALAEGDGSWLTREVRLLWQRVLKRVELSARTVVAVVEPGSCFTGTLTELVLLADRSFMLEGSWEDSNAPAPTIKLTKANLGWYRMANDISRLETRFWGRPEALRVAADLAGKALLAHEAVEAELVTMAMDDIDWEDEIRLMLEERASFSPDALTAMEANIRFVGPETMETKIFARLSAWQNWIFQRPNAVGSTGALQRFGTGSRPSYDLDRV
jgi:benzoyl-CoA-dihydrodiol lyase